MRARLNDEGALVEVVLIAPESGTVQTFMYSNVNSADQVELPEDVTNVDDLPDCDDINPMIEPGPCQGSAFERW